MKSVLPILFIALAGLFLCAVLFALWHSLRLLVTGRERQSLVRAEGAERQALLEEKRELLTTIRDIELERDLGKVSQRDFERLDKQYRTRARQVLQELDEQLAPHRERADKLLSEALSGKGGGGAAKAPQATEASEADHACPKCGQSNDGDAVFCKKCATRLAPEAEGT